MNNDYLWDKTGDDAEVEQLEDLLSGFRYVETDPPELPAMNIIPVRASWQSRFGWILALGTAAAVVVLAAIYVQTLRMPQQPTEDKAAITAPNVDTTASVNTPPTPIDIPAVTTAVPKKREAPRATQAIVKTRKPRAIAPLLARKEPAEKLTKEELYAYNQVKLALFITGSKLRTVSDVIDKIEGRSDENLRKNK